MSVPETRVEWASPKAHTETLKNRTPPGRRPEVLYLRASPGALPASPLLIRVSKVHVWKSFIHAGFAAP